VVPPSLGANFDYTLHLLCMKGTNNTWEYQTKVPTDRQQFAVANFAGRIVVVGGWLHGPSAVVEAYDGANWQELPELLTPRFACAAAQMGNRLFVTGGSDGYSTLSSLESFDGAKWRAELPLSQARQQHSALVYNGRLWVLGGVSVVGTNTATLNSVESFVLRVEEGGIHQCCVEHTMSPTVKEIRNVV